MVQALAFAELLAGGILFLMGLRGQSLSEVIQGTEAGEETEGGLLHEAEAHEKSLGEAFLENTPVGRAEAQAPRQAGETTWLHLRTEVKEGKLTESQLQEKLNKLTGK